MSSTKGKRKHDANGGQVSKKKQKQAPTLTYGTPVAMLAEGAGPPRTLIPYSIGFEGKTKTNNTIVKYMMRGFGGAKFKSIVKEHDTEADAIKYINSVVRKKLRGMKNKELEGGPRTNVYRIVNTKSNCEDKAPHLRHALADIYSQCGIPACCSELGCEDCFQDL